MTLFARCKGCGSGDDYFTPGCGCCRARAYWRRTFAAGRLLAPDAQGRPWWGTARG